MLIADGITGDETFRGTSLLRYRGDEGTRHVQFFCTMLRLKLICLRHSRLSEIDLQWEDLQHSSSPPLDNETGISTKVYKHPQSPTPMVIWIPNLHILLS